MIKPSFMGYKERTTEILALVYSDICGPFNVSAKEDFIYFITFIDNFLWYGYVYLMHHKFGTFEKFKEFRYEAKK